MRRSKPLRSRAERGGASDPVPKATSYRLEVRGVATPIDGELEVRSLAQAMGAARSAGPGSAVLVVRDGEPPKVIDAMVSGSSLGTLAQRRENRSS